MADWACDLDDAGDTRERARDRKRQNDQLICIEAAKRAARGAAPTTRISNP